MIALLLTSQAMSAEPQPRWEAAPLLRHDIPRPLPTDDPSFHGVVDLEDLVIVRPQGTELQMGFTHGAFTRVVEAAVADRSAIDFAVVMHSDQLPTQFSGAAAFHLSYNNTHLFGTGKYHVSTPNVPIQAALWMSYPSYWDTWSEGADVWVFGQELGHQWLAFPEFHDGVGPSRGLLGRANSHWSYFLDTPSSPMEGNRWIDHGDGSFTTDLQVTPTFSPLDLYLMGLVEASDVPSMFLIEPDPGVVRVASSPPEFLFRETPITVVGTRAEVTLDDVIAQEGARHPDASTAQRDFTLLPVLVVGPDEMLTSELVQRVLDRFDAWAVGWTQPTHGLWSVDFTVGDEPRALPAPTDDVLVPRGAW